MVIGAVTDATPIEPAHSGWSIARDAIDEDLRRSPPRHGRGRFGASRPHARRHPTEGSIAGHASAHAATVCLDTLRLETIDMRRLSPTTVARVGRLGRRVSGCSRDATLPRDDRTMRRGCMA